MVEETARLALPLMAAAQAHKEVTHNEALERIDWVLNATIDGLSSVPPANPAAGGCWIVGAAPSGAWTQHSGEIARWSGGGWTFLAPQPGYIAWHRATGSHVVFDGTGWRVEAWPVRKVEVNGKTVLADRQAAIANPVGGSTIDVQARATLMALLNAARAHGLIES